MDVELSTYNTTAQRVADAIGPRTRAIVTAHALGNPFEVAEIADLATEHDRFFVASASRWWNAPPSPHLAATSTSGTSS